MPAGEQLDHPVFDADNHYYEAQDAFTRHLDPSLATRVIQWCEIGGRRYHVIGGRVSHAVTNPTFDPIAKPGALGDYFRGNPEGRNPIELLSEREPIRPGYRNAEARLDTLDEQGLEGCWLFPTLGMIYEEPLSHDPVAVCALFRAFNRWLAEDWPFNYRDRIYSAPYITLADPAWARDELEWALGAGATSVVMRPAPPVTAQGRVNPFDPLFEGFWGLADEAGIAVVVHAGDAGLSSNGYAEDGFSASFSGGGWRPSIKGFHIEQAIRDFLLTCVFEKHLERHPRLRIVSVENGAEFLGEMFRKVRSTQNKMPGYFTEDPIARFREQVWINPFWEDDVHEVIEHMGPDRVVFGSDWPHIEALPEPLDYLRELKDVDPADARKILYDNARALLVPLP